MQIKNQKSKTKLSLKNGGQAVLISVVLLMLVSLAAVTGYVTPAMKEVQRTRGALNSQKSYALAEAAEEDAIYRIKTGKQYQSNYNFTINGDVAPVSITSSGNTRTVQADGLVGGGYRKVRAVVDIATDSVDFFYGVQVGAGGLEMDENAEVVGNIYSNGPISGENGSTIDGDAIVAGHIEESVQARSMNCTTDQIVGQSSPQIDFAQGFIAPASEPLSKVSLYLKKVGVPADRTVRITADNGGSPADESLASGTLRGSLVTTAYGWIDITFSSPPLLIGGNSYWIVLDASHSSSKYWIWCRDSNNGYGNGIGKYSEDWDDDPWTQITGDLDFRTYFGSGASTLQEVIVLGDAKSNTITNSKICGDAYYQSIDSSSLNFLNSPTSQVCGTPTSSGTAYPGAADPPLENMPVSQANIDGWKSDAVAGGQILGDYSVTTNVSLGPKEITGDLLMTSNNKTLTVTGTLYVHGNVDIQNGSAIRCDFTYGEDSCLIVTDGWIHVENNSTFSGSGTAGSYLMMLTTLACDGSFSTGCTHHNGAVDIHNNATGVIFYAANGMINLHNGVNVTEVTAYKLRLDNTATITYDQGLANATFSSGPSGGWRIRDWREVQ